MDEDIFVDEPDLEGEKIIEQYEKAASIPDPVWQWNVLGVPLGIVFLMPELSWWKRFWCKVFFGSTFKKVRKE